MYFESEAGSRYRLVRATKNRFGAAHELGFFAMSERGLKEVRNPAAIFLARSPEPCAGSIVTVHSITTLGDPQGFAVTVYADNGVSNVFDEGDYDGLYPFSLDLRGDQ